MSAIVATRDRPAIVRASLARVRVALSGIASEIIVVDDASGDRSAERLVPEGLADHVVVMARNRGVEAFNAGAACARGRYLLVLDDDAWPDAGSVERGAAVLDEEHAVGAVAMHPRHPESGRSEWPFVDDGTPVCLDWPLIGPGSLVRADAWRAAGGYEGSYFLYANDTDLALKLLGLGLGVWMDPGVVVWHDCPTAARRPRRWFRLAVRNRIWTARRHARGAAVLAYAGAAALEAHHRAGLDIRRHWSACVGAAAGLVRRPPTLPPGVRRDGVGMARLFALRAGWRCEPARGCSAPAPRAEPARIERVTAVVPSFGRHRDIEMLLADLCRQRDAGVRLDVVVVDNASQPPLDTVAAPDGLRVRFLRLAENRGGSGGFNAGIAHALGADPSPDAVWLLDSDVRLGRGCLRALVGALRGRQGLIGAGSAMVDPLGSGVYEIGGRIDRRTGHYRPAAQGRRRLTTLIDAEYLAATSLLMRSGPIRRVGLLPEVFLNGDDVEWTVRLARETGGRLVGVAGSVIEHPMGQSPTLARYYQARNALRPARAAGLAVPARAARVWIEAGRAFAMALLDRDDLSLLHVRGLRDGLRRAPPARPEALGIAPSPGYGPGATAFARALDGSPDGAVVLHPRLRLAPKARVGLAAALREAGLAGLAGRVRDLEPGPLRPLASGDLRAGLARLWRGPGAAFAVAPLDEHPSVWACAEVVLLVWPGGSALVDGAWRRRGVRAARRAAAALLYGLGAAAGRAERSDLPGVG